MGCTSRVKRIDGVLDERLMALVSAAEAVNVTAEVNTARKLFPQIRLAVSGFTVIFNGCANTGKSD